MQYDRLIFKDHLETKNNALVTVCVTYFYLAFYFYDRMSYIIPHAIIVLFCDTISYVRSNCWMFIQKQQ